MSSPAPGATPNSAKWVPEPSVTDWLLDGDPAIEFQARRDLLDERGQKARSARGRIATEGWGRRLLAQRHVDGHWGRGFYQPKWTCSHYTLLDLRNLEIEPTHPKTRDSIHGIATTEKRTDGGIGPGSEAHKSDVCVNGMFLNYASYFGEPESELTSIVDFLISQHMADGGFNCRSNRSECHHSSLHSTLSVLEGFHEYRKRTYQYRSDEIAAIIEEAREFILIHRFFRSDRTGAIIQPSFLRFTYPPRWKYHALRALDHFAVSGVPWDDRMLDLLNLIVDRRRPDGRWFGAASHPGAVHFKMEPARQPSRWATIAALRTLKAYGRPGSA